MESPPTIETDMSEEKESMVEGIVYIMNIILSGCKGNKHLAAVLARAAYVALLLSSYEGNYSATGEALKQGATEDAASLNAGLFDTVTSKVTLN